MGIENKNYCLCLNKHWLPLHVKSVRDAITSMCPDGKEASACLGLDIQYELNDLGWPDFDKPISMELRSWEEWVDLEVKPWHLSISTAHKNIRIPTVIITRNYDKIPVKKLRPTKAGIWARDKGICQVSGKRLSKKELNVDHIIPVSRGGKDTWTNLVLMDKQLNTIKGQKTLEEIGWKLIKQPTEPLAMPCFSAIEKVEAKDWEHFLIKN